MSDRALQDRVIRYLTDAGERAGGAPPLPLSQVEAARARRFANFLARHYYRDRLARSFQYSYEFREQTSRSAEQTADSPEFEVFQKVCVLGSLESARCVGDMARRYMLSAAPPVEWWASLIEYEYAYFLQAATSEVTPASQFPSRSRGALVKKFEWSMPELLTRIRAFKAPANPTSSQALSTVNEIESADLRREVTLLFSRNSEGKLFVVEVDSAVESVFNAVDGSRGLEEMAAIAAAPTVEAEQVMAALANIGAIMLRTQS